MTILEPVITTEALAMAALADCVCDELTNTGAGPLCWCGLYPGAQISWEFCGECTGDVCGMGWVRLVSIFPYGLQATTAVSQLAPNCFLPRAAQIEVGALRCMPTSPDGLLGDPETLSRVTVNQLADQAALYRAIVCCEVGGLTIERYDPLGPTGGCVGGSWTAFLALDPVVAGSDVRVDISDVAIISALNTPGGGVFRWRDEVMREIVRKAQATSPHNDPDNANHRGGEVGVYAASWHSHRTGNGHRVGMVVGNRADHATYVEFGYSGSWKFQVFSWTGWQGGIMWVGADTKRNRARAQAHWAKPKYSKMKVVGPRAGQYILTRATYATVGSSTL